MGLRVRVLDNYVVRDCGCVETTSHIFDLCIGEWVLYKSEFQYRTKELAQTAGNSCLRDMLRIGPTDGIATD